MSGDAAGIGRHFAIEVAIRGFDPLHYRGYLIGGRPRDSLRRHLAGVKFLSNLFPAVAVMERCCSGRRKVLRKVQSPGSDTLVVTAYTVAAKKGLHCRGESVLGRGRLSARTHQEKNYGEMLEHWTNLSVSRASKPGAVYTM
jgi:hypothetical protein